MKSIVTEYTTLHHKFIFFPLQNYLQNDGSANLKIIVYQKLMKHQSDNDQPKRNQDSYDRELYMNCEQGT